MSDSILDRLNVSGLPSPPNVAVQILELCQDPSSSIDDLGKVLSLDPALAAQILKVSNSASYSRGREVTSLPQAIMTLGARTISIIALGFSLKGAIPNWQHESGISDEQLWRQNVATAVTSKSLARLSRHKEVDAVFLCGLLSRIGQLLLFTVAPEEYGQVLTVAAGEMPTPDQEKEILGITHQEAGGLLLEQWKLPSLITTAVKTWGTDALSEDETVAKAAMIVEVSDISAQMVFSEEKATRLQRIYALAEDKLGLSGGEVDRMFTSSGTDIAETLKVFDIQTDGEIDCDEILETARTQLVNVSLGLVADLSEARDNTSTLIEENKELAKKTLHDALTGLNNRAALDAELEAMEVARARAKTQFPYSIIMIDIDKFKSVNDTYGHAAGDDVLRSVGATLADSSRATDFVARYGGEEFAVVLTNVGRSEAESIAERFRGAIQRRRIELKDRTLEITASLGVASSDAFPPNTHFDEVIQRADKALYDAKRGGRNQVVCYNADTTKAAQGSA